jgi:predicted dehydrogenase
LVILAIDRCSTSFAIIRTAAVENSMNPNFAARREFLKQAGWVGSAAMLAALPESTVHAQGAVIEDAVLPRSQDSAPKHHIRFAVCGISHDHIYGMVDAIQRGGGELAAVWGAEPEKLAAFTRRFPGAKVVHTQDEILNHPSIQLVLSSQIAVERAPLGVRVMQHGKDYLADKPGIVTLGQLAEVRRAIAATGRIYAILYSERFEVKAAVYAGELVRQGAIGSVIQTINIAPHQVFQPGGLNGGGSGRPGWFWDPDQYGGILCDIGSHQVDQFLFYTGSTSAEIAAAQVANLRHPEHPRFQDFGDMLLRGNRGFGYVRLDWFTPGGLGAWGDGRLFILGAEGYIEVRKYADVAVEPQGNGLFQYADGILKPHGNNLFLVDKNGARYFDCNQMTLPFGPQFVADIVNRTHTAQDQAQCLLAAELAIRAQNTARHVTLEA